MLGDLDRKCSADVTKCARGCNKIWLEVSERRWRPRASFRKLLASYPQLSRKSAAVIADLVESTRRAVVREFSPVETKAWKELTAAGRREEVFWELPRPGRGGPPNVSARGVSKKQKLELMFMPVNDFIQTYPEYMKAMLQVQIEDGVHLNRERAVKKGFRPMRVEAILKKLT